MQFRESTRTNNESAAVTYCLKRVSAIQQATKAKAEGQLPSITIDAAFARYFQEKVQYYSQPKQILSRLFYIRDHIGVTYLHELDKQVLSNFVNLRKKTVSNATINRELSALSAVRTLAKNFWEVRINDTRPLQFKQLEPAEHIKYLPDWETAQKIIDRAAPHLKPIIYTALYTGMRRGNILGLRWEDLDFKNNTITVRVKDKNTEGGKNLTIPMIDKLKEILLEQSRINDFVFNFRGHPIKDIKHAWQGIFFDRTGRLKDKTLPYTNFHTLRHTAATWILKKTNNLRITKEILGHADIKTTMKYAHVLDEEKRRALNAVFD